MGLGHTDPVVAQGDKSVGNDGPVGTENLGQGGAHSRKQVVQPPDYAAAVQDRNGDRGQNGQTQENVAQLGTAVQKIPLFPQMDPPKL